LGEEEDIEYLHQVVSDGTAFASFRQATPVLMTRIFLEVSDFPSAVSVFSRFIADDEFMSDIERASAVLSGVARLRERADSLVPEIAVLARCGKDYENVALRALVAIGSQPAILEAFVIYDRFDNRERRHESLSRVFSTARNCPFVIAGFTSRVTSLAGSEMAAEDVAAVFFDISTQRWTEAQIVAAPPRSSIPTCLRESIILADALIHVGLDSRVETAVIRRKELDIKILGQALAKELINQWSLQGWEIDVELSPPSR